MPSQDCTCSYTMIPRFFNHCQIHIVTSNMDDMISQIPHRSRGGTKSLIFHVTFANINHIIVGVSPYSCSVEAKKLQDPQGIVSLNVITSISNHSHTLLFGDPEGSPSKIANKVYYVKSMAIIISYLLWHRSNKNGDGLQCLAILSWQALQQYVTLLF